MVTLVVQAHPLDDSYNAALLEHVCVGLRAADEEFVVCRIGEGDRPTAERLSVVKRLVLVYPTWGGGQPALLLDWLHEMLTRDAFRSVTHFQVATTHGSSQLVNRMQGAWGQRFLADRIIGVCEPGASFDWHALYKIDRCTYDETRAFLDETQQYFAKPFVAV